MDGTILRSFEMDKTLYVISQNAIDHRQNQLAEIFCKLNDIDYTGESLSHYIGSIFMDQYPNIFSKMNPDVYERFHLKNVKNRAHFGKCSNKRTDEEIHERGISKDINKCYRYCMENKLEPWLLLSFNDCWSSYDESVGTPTGLYVIDTVDQSMFKGSNIYSSAMVQYAEKENIPFKILEILKVTEKHPSYDFNMVITTFREQSFGNDEIFKSMVNSLAGLIGKSANKNTKRVVMKIRETI